MLKQNYMEVLTHSWQIQSGFSITVLCLTPVSKCHKYMKISILLFTIKAKGCPTNADSDKGMTFEGLIFTTNISKHTRGFLKYSLHSSVPFIILEKSFFYSFKFSHKRRYYPLQSEGGIPCIRNALRFCAKP